MKWMERVNVSTRKHPIIKNTTILISVVFLAGLGTGISITISLEKQLAIVGTAAYFGAFFSVLTAAMLILNRVQEWQKNKNRPSLEFDGVRMDLQSRNHKALFSCCQYDEIKRRVKELSCIFKDRRI
jgi:hypothetical protein